MRFLHLADLHLGKRLNDVELLEDQKYALKQAIDLNDRYDAVLISGDVYDKQDPKAEAMTLFDNFVTSFNVFIFFSKFFFKFFNFLF